MSELQTRFDAVLIRMDRIYHKAKHTVVGRELREVTEELVKLRNDLANMKVEGADRWRTFQRPKRLNTAGLQKIHGGLAKPPEGKRYCAKHDGGKGEMLDEDEFDWKDPEATVRKSWCRECTREYQRERYVRVGYKVVTVEVQENDACVGHQCPVCRMPFQPGQRVQGENLHHEECVPREV